MAQVIRIKRTSGGVCPTPSGIRYNRPQLTGQTTSYRTGDDAWAVINRPPPSDPVNPIHTTKLVDWFTLANNNAFGSTDRFTDELGTQVYANRYAIDHYTGLAWINARGYGTWNQMIDQALLYTDTFGNSDYFLANQNQSDSIYNEQANQYNYSPFTVLWGGFFNYAWNSTTIQLNGNGRRSGTQYRSIPTPKTTVNYGIRCRWHF